MFFVIKLMNQLYTILVSWSLCSCLFLLHYETCRISALFVHLLVTLVDQFVNSGNFFSINVFSRLNIGMSVIETSHLALS